MKKEPAWSARLSGPVDTTSDSETEMVSAKFVSVPSSEQSDRQRNSFFAGLTDSDGIRTTTLAASECDPNSD